MVRFTDNLCQHAINNCDCCGIENLVVSNPCHNENNGCDDEDYLDVELETFKQLQLELKFSNLKRLKFFNLVLFYTIHYTLLKPTINKINSKVEINSFAWKN